MVENKPKILVIVGPTASGKSALAVKLAKKLGGEIISADSRQVYRGLDIGSGKVTKKEMAGIPHHLLDVADPKRQFSVSRYQKLALQKIKEILKRGKLPIIVGGTGFYVDAVVTGIALPAVPPNNKLRTKLNKKSTTELLEILKNLDPERAEKIDQNNPRRLIRAIEIATALGHVPKAATNPPPYQFIKIGLGHDPEVLRQKIIKRTRQQLKQGLVNETKKLNRQGVSWRRLEALGLEYKYAALYLQGKITARELAVQLEQSVLQYAKRQLTWWRRDQELQWLTPSEARKWGKTW